MYIVKPQHVTKLFFVEIQFGDFLDTASHRFARQKNENGRVVKAE